MSKRQYKRWSDQEKAWLLLNMSKGNIELSKILNRTIESIESMKRDLRKGKAEADEDYVEALKGSPQIYDQWMVNWKSTVSDYKSTLHYESEKPTPKVEPTEPKVIHPPVYVNHDPEGEDASCLGDKMEELGVPSIDLTKHGLWMVLGMFAVLIVLIVLLMNL